MNTARHRRIEARERRWESLHSRDITTEKTAQFPQPKNLIKNETVKVEKAIKKEIAKKNELPKAPEIVKRGRGRPRKTISENINTNKKAIAGNKKLASAKGKR